MARSRICAQRGELERALSDASTAVKLCPEDAQNYETRADVWLFKAERDQATLTSIRSAPSSSYVSEPAWNSLSGQDAGRNWAFRGGQSGSPDPAVDYALSLHAQTGNSAPRAFNAGGAEKRPLHDLDYALKITEDYDHAITDLNESLRLDPKRVEALTRRACAYWHLNKFDKAIDDFSDAIRLDGKIVKLRVYRSSLYQLQGDLDKALADLNTAIRLDPKLADAYKARADLYARKHEINKAAADYAEAERLKPSDDRYR